MDREWKARAMKGDAGSHALYGVIAFISEAIFMVAIPVAAIALIWGIADRNGIILGIGVASAVIAVLAHPVRYRLKAKLISKKDANSAS